MSKKKRKKKVNWGFMFFLAGMLLIVLFSAIRFDIAPAHGKAYGYIYYQEKSGVFQLNSVCWKDTPYDNACEWFDPAGTYYEPGKYTMEYDCGTFVWSWEHPSTCRIVNATRLEDLQDWKINELMDCLN